MQIGWKVGGLTPSSQRKEAIWAETLSAPLCLFIPHHKHRCFKRICQLSFHGRGTNAPWSNFWRLRGMNAGLRTNIKRDRLGKKKKKLLLKLIKIGTNAAVWIPTFCSFNECVVMKTVSASIKKAAISCFVSHQKQNCSKTFTWLWQHKRIFKKRS